MFSFNFWKKPNPISPTVMVEADRMEEVGPEPDPERVEAQPEILSPQSAKGIFDGLAPSLRDELYHLVESMVPQRIVRDNGPMSLRQAVSVVVESNPLLGMYLDRFGYRTTGQSIRDMSEAARLAALRRAEWAVTAHPVACRGQEIRTNMVVSEGFNIQALSTKKEYADQIQRVIDIHWKYNEWEGRLFERALDLGVTGEIIRMRPTLSAQVLNGEAYRQPFFRAGMILPHNVKNLIVNPFDAERLLKIAINMPDTATKNGWKLQEFNIVEQQLFGKYAGTVTGDVLYHGVKRRPGATRGVTDLLPVLEWLDMHDQLLFSEAERTKNLLKHIWDVTLVGADSKRVIERADELRRTPPNNGTVYVHNDKEIWKTVVPGLTSAQSLGLIDAIFKLAWGGMGLPEHYYVSADTVNRASAQEMSEPVWQWARTRKTELMNFLRMEFELAIQIAADNGEIDVPLSERGIEVVSRDPDRTAYDAVGATLQSSAQALGLALSNRLIDLPAAQGIFKHIVEANGFKLSDKMNLPDDFDKLVEQSKDTVDAQKPTLSKTTMEPKDPVKSPGWGKSKTGADQAAEKQTAVAK